MKGAFRVLDGFGGFVPGWFYVLKEPTFAPGEICEVRHVVPGEKPLAKLAEAERAL